LVGVPASPAYAGCIFAGPAATPEILLCRAFNMTLSSPRGFFSIRRKAGQTFQKNGE
jgi:hypothetical protein